MANTQVVQARVDREVKKQASSVLAALGLTTSDIIRMALTRIALDKQLPPGLMTPNAATLEAIKDARAGRMDTVAIDGLFEGLDEDG